MGFDARGNRGEERGECVLPPSVEIMLAPLRIAICDTRHESDIENH